LQTIFERRGGVPTVFHGPVANHANPGISFRATFRLPGRTIRTGEYGFRIVICDLDDDCARDLAPQLLVWGPSAAAPIPFGVALARREYEAWFLASLPALVDRGAIQVSAVFHGAPEAVRDAKGRLGHLMPRGRHYSETADQARLSAQIDLAQAFRSASSFRKLIKELCRLLKELGHSPVIPPEWTAG
jgi:hypothetical protein